MNSWLLVPFEILMPCEFTINVVSSLTGSCCRPRYPDYQFLRGKGVIHFSIKIKTSTSLFFASALTT